MKLFSRKPSPIECQQVVELVTAYVEGTLDAKDRKRLEAHFGACPHCSAYLEQIRETISITGAITPDELSQEALSDLHNVFRAWAAEES